MTLDGKVIQDYLGELNVIPMTIFKICFKTHGFLKMIFFLVVVRRCDYGRDNQRNKTNIASFEDGEKGTMNQAT